VAMHHTLRHIRLLIAACCLAVAALALPATASAMLVGAESNGELVNSDRTPALQAAALDKMRAQGVQVVRVNFGWNEMAVNCAGRSAAALGNHTDPCYTWGVLDSLVTLAKARKIQVLISTSRAPGWLHNSTDPYFLGQSTAQFNRTVSYYAAFLRAAGTRYGPGSKLGTIKYWTIWNEPNSDTFFKPRPDAVRYAQMYAAAAVALRGAHATAQIAPGPTGPNSTIKPVAFIKSFQAAVVRYLPRSNPRRFITAWAHNPYPGNTTAPSYARSFPHPDAIGMGQLSRLFRTLDAKPITRGLKVWGTEFGWQTPPETNAKLVVSVSSQAQFLAEAYDLLERTGRVPIGIWYGLTDNQLLADWQSGTFTFRGTAKPSFYMYQRMISVPRGSVPIGTTVAVWGRSNLAPSKGRLVFRRGTTGRWYNVPGQKRSSDGSIRATLKITTSTTQVATYDTTYGYYRQVVGR
jgi:hypothetical protein